MDKETFISEYKGLVVTIAALVILGIVLLMSFLFSSKSIALRSVPNQSQKTFKAGEAYTIAWSASNVSRVGIVLFNGDKPQWVVQNYPASEGKFIWESYANQDSGTNYRFAVFEYPWKKGNPIAYSPTAIEIVGKKYASCDDYEVEKGWPFLPDSYPNIHRVFITSQLYSGAMGGIEGADTYCKQEAEKNNYPGTYMAFLGTDKVSASERITKDGVFVEAEPIGKLPEGRTCHRLIAESVQKMLDKTRLPKALAEIELSETFAKRLGEIWYGRRTESTDTKCLQIPVSGVIGAFSGTYTCQDWSLNKRQVYTGPVPSEADLPRCYDKEGKSVMANYFGATAGLLDDSRALLISADTCDNSHRIMCVEQ